MNQSSGIRVLVPAAGTGSRMAADRPKQYLALLGQPLIQHTLSRLAQCSCISHIHIGISEADSYWADIEPDIAGLPKYAGSFPGGSERASTVLNGLQAISGETLDTDWIMVHDAARPCIRCDDVETLAQTVRDRAGNKILAGGLLGLPVSDTVKRTNEESEVTETVSRLHLWRALTPQMFRYGELREALVRALSDNVAVTDEASAMEYAGAKPLMVAGHSDNIKVTTPQDLVLAELFLRQQGQD